MESNAIVFIPLTQGKVAVIDFEDFEKVRPYKWHVHKADNNFYARHRIGENGPYIYMHRFLLDVPSGGYTDHRDGDGLNNRRYNIRGCTNTQNGQSFRRKRLGVTSKFRGVWKDKRYSGWVSQIKVNGKKFHLGTFKLEEDAARAYDKKARELFGEWASPNFPI